MTDPVPSSDRVAARLAEILERARIAGDDSAVATDEDIFRSSEDVPALLAAVEAVLALHSADAAEPPPELCKSDPFAWPCPTYRAIARALLGEDER